MYPSALRTDDESVVHVLVVCRGVGVRVLAVLVLDLLPLNGDHAHNGRVVDSPQIRFVDAPVARIAHADRKRGHLHFCLR